MSDGLLQDYLTKVDKYYKTGIATEHTYRGTLQELLESLDITISATNEPKRVKCGAPDYVIQRNNLTIGYIEAKDIGTSLDKIEKDEQLGRYRHALDNLILTDYIEFRWYVQGEKRLEVRLATRGTDKRLPLDKENVATVEQLLRSFLEHSPEPISKPQELAKRMARLAHMIRDIIIDAFQQKEASDNLQDLYSSFQEVLLPDLKVSEFADMFSQTMAYGLFAARYNHTQNRPFRRDDAAKEIPRTNPFLRRLFATIAGPDLDDEPFVGFVDELAQVLAFTDMEAVLADFGKHTRQEDPIVHFYETFLAQYDPKLRELRGVYYTPEPVVSYIVRSVDHLLHEHFDCPNGLADTTTVSSSYIDDNGIEHIETTPRVLILDPATGTGTFLYHVIAHIRETFRHMGNAGMWSGYVREHLLSRLFGFELLMAPYAMAHLKLGIQLAAVDLPKAEQATWAYDFKSNERLGIYLTNTLDEAIKRSDVLFGRYISDEANEAARVKRSYPVMVILGNPPYSGHSANNGQWIKDLLRGKDSQTGYKTSNYFEVDEKPLGEQNPKYLYDDYVKFIRFAQWRIEKTGYGILAFITNHGYLDNPTFRGMRQSLMQSFDDIYVLDLHGNSKKKEQSPDRSKDENVFDIQQGVAIGIFVKRQQKVNTLQRATVHHAHLWGSREIYEKTAQAKELVGGKYHWLAEHDITNTEWTTLTPQAPFYLFIPQNVTLQVEYDRGWKVTDIMPVNSTGVKTHRDHFAVDFDKTSLVRRINEMRDTSMSDDDYAEKYNLADTRDWKLTRARQQIRKDADWQRKIIHYLYRPFDRRFCYLSEVTMDNPRRELSEHIIGKENVCIGLGRQGIAVNDPIWSLLAVSRAPVDTNIFRRGGTTLFPLYLYPHTNQSLFDASIPTDSRHPNLASAFTEDFSIKLKMHFIPDGKGNLQQTFGPEDIFNYMYATFHAPTYRERYAEFLKIDFPRLPLTSNGNLFRELCKLGDRLVRLHLMEQFAKVTTRYRISGSNVVEKIDYTSSNDAPEQGRVWINKTQFIEGVLPEIWDFQIGGYQVCQKWLKDRKGRNLSFNDITHYQHIIANLVETLSLMREIDQAINEHGDWPIQ
jgi:predicted helicase